MIEIKEITNKKNWEEFLQNNASGSYPFFQSWQWGEVQEKIGCPIQRLGVFDNNILRSVLLVIEIVAKRGHYLYLRHGPVGIEPHYLLAFLDHLKTYAKTKNISFIRVSRFPKIETVSASFFTHQKFLKSPLQTIDTEICWVLSLDKTEPALLAQMRKSHRYLIKKALTLDLQVTMSNITADIEKFLPLYTTLAKRKHFSPHKGVKEEFAIFGNDNQEVLFLVTYQKKVIAGSLIAFVGDTAIYRHSALDEAYRHLPASYLIQWEAIKEAKKRGMKLYNFWGIAPPHAKHHPWAGHSLFKTGFGGEPEYYLPTMDLPLHFWYWKNYAIDWISKIQKG